MRIITGSARGTRLVTLEGDEITRPTSEAVKEAVFSMIQFEIEGHNVLDLFAGSGQLALEAVSRGARSALLVDSNRAAVDIIKQNIEKTHLSSACRVLNTDYKAAIRTITGKEKFGIVFLDPPYASDMLTDALERILRADIVLDNGYIVCESPSPEPITANGTSVKRFAKYGKKYVTLLVKNCEDAE